MLNTRSVLWRRPNSHERRLIRNSVTIAGIGALATISLTPEVETSAQKLHTNENDDTNDVKGNSVWSSPTPSYPIQNSLSSPPLSWILINNIGRYASSALTAPTLLSTTRCESTTVESPPPTSITLPSRDDQLARLKSGETFDVFVVGGGATGAGAALDAASRGLSTALIERGDFGNETSSRSTKLIWAGIRYIATAASSLLRFKNVFRPIDAVSDFISEFKMVHGAHVERKILVDNNPHLVNWVPIAIPFTSWMSWPAPFGHPLFSTFPVLSPAVFKFYDGMSGFTCPPSHVMKKTRAERKFPQLDENVKYYQVFYEAQHNDARTNTVIALTAAEEGAAIANYVEMIGLIRDEETGKATGVRCRDNRDGSEFEVKAKAIVFAGGPFTDKLREIEDPKAAPAVAAAAGTHIVLPSYFSPGGFGMLDVNTSDGRFLFFLPWQGHTLVGTTDRKGPVESTHGPPEEEIQWLLHEVQKYLSDDIKVRRNDVLSAWQGYRPLASDPHAVAGAPVSRSHVISTNPDTGVTFVTGGKWTTYREMAEDTIDRVIKLHNLQPKSECSTATRSLRGGKGYCRNLPITLIQDFGVGVETAHHLARTYGMNAIEVCRSAAATSKRWPRFGNLLVEGFPHLECEVPYVCKNEMVCTVIDMLTLRTRIAFLNKDAAVAAAPRVAELMAKELGWSRTEKNRQLKDALDTLATFGGPIPDKASVEAELEKVKTVQEVFRTLDAGKNGYIDLTEFKDCCKMLGIPFASDEEALLEFRKIDLNKNGKIEESEFVTWWEKSSKLKTMLKGKFKFAVDKAGPESGGVAFG